jgi:FHS family glucose/mannose:H+ symporter-like MFS transporter
MKRLIWMGCALYLLIGLAHVVLGAILPQLLSHYQLDYKDGGMLIFLQFFGFFIGVLTTPNWLNKLGRRQLVLMALLGLFAAQVMYSFLPSWHWMLAAAPIAGFGFGIIEAAIGALIIEFVTEKKAVAMSRVEVFFGVGAMLMPMAAGFFILKGMWELSFPFIALHTLILVFVWSFMSFGEINNLFEKKLLSADVKPVKPSYSKESMPILYLMILFFILYVGIEMSIVNFLPSMMIENNIASKATATISVTIFWSTMIVGRIFAGNIAEKIKYARYLTYSSFGALTFLLLFSFSTNIWSTYTIIFGLGLLMSGIFAIGLIFADHVLPGMTARTTSTLVAAGGVGGAVFPLLTGWSMDTFPIYISKWLLIGTTLAMVVVLLLAVQFSKTQHKNAMSPALKGD